MKPSIKKYNNKLQQLLGITQILYIKVKEKKYPTVELLTSKLQLKYWKYIIHTKHLGPGQTIFTCKCELKIFI